jgi:peptidoglycan/LPS O-acetylase OafA/YrhL
MGTSRRFATLDLLRGLAAIVVMLWHSQGRPVNLPGGYLAVDLFFGISGFVMALTYEGKLRDELTLGRFIALRVARLWPMLLVGASIGIVLLGGWPGMLILLPDPWSPGSLYPANGAFWSLLFEMTAYLAFALLAPRLRLRGVVVATVLSALALAGIALFDGIRVNDFGGYWQAIPHGLARVGFSFACGVLLFRLREAYGTNAVVTGRAWLIPAALVVLMAVVPVPGQVAGLLAILVALPALLWLATGWEVPQSRLAALLSDISYPLYCIHVPLLMAGAELELPLLPTWVALLALSYLLDRYWDRPVRRAMRDVATGTWRRPKLA